MAISQEIRLEVNMRGINQLRCVCHGLPEGYTCAYEIYQDGVRREWYRPQTKSDISYWPAKSGEYYFHAILSSPEGKRIRLDSEPVRIELETEIYCNIEEERRPLDVFRNVGRVLTEIWENRKRMFAISRYTYKTLNKDSYLGNFWNLLNPFIQIATYWFVFGVGLRTGRDVEGYPYIVWMLCGMVPWFFMSAAITKGAGAIRSRGISALKLRYPIVTMPLEEMLVCFYGHIPMVGILFVLMLAFGVRPSIYWLNIGYYFIYAITFFTALAMITSVLSMLALDFQKLINSLIRLLFYLTPILWSMDHLPNWTKLILKMNPCLYYVNGFRDSLLYETPFYVHYKLILFFWTINLILIVIGANLQTKYKNQFLDME